MEQRLTDVELSEIVERARCGRCDGKGFRLAPLEDERGERIPGKFDKLDCPDCDGNGIKLGICRRLAKVLAGTGAQPGGQEGLDIL